jgi:hypothetical protein
VIGRVVRGWRAYGLIAYLFGPAAPTNTWITGLWPPGTECPTGSNHLSRVSVLAGIRGST